MKHAGPVPGTWHMLNEQIIVCGFQTTGSKRGNRWAELWFTVRPPPLGNSTPTLRLPSPQASPIYHLLMSLLPMSHHKESQ